MNKYKEINKEIKRSLKFAVQVVILNESGEVLAVSRKDNHNDFGLPGGKMDPEDNTLQDALIREVKEETGLSINKEDLMLVFSMHKDGYMGYTFLCEKYEGDIETDEPHVVKWAPFIEVCKGSFGRWNSMVNDSLINMGIKFLYYPMMDREYVFSIEKDENLNEEAYIFYISPKYSNEGDGKWTYYERGDEIMEMEIKRMLNTVNANVNYLDEASMCLNDFKNMDKLYTKEEVCKLLTDAGFTKDKFDL